jgi:hypothetical protein
MIMGKIGTMIGRTQVPLYIRMHSRRLRPLLRRTPCPTEHNVIDNLELLIEAMARHQAHQFAGYAIRLLHRRSFRQLLCGSRIRNGRPIGQP